MAVHVADRDAGVTELASKREAAKDRAQLLDDKGLDANHATEKIVEIRKTVQG